MLCKRRNIFEGSRAGGGQPRDDQVFLQFESHDHRSAFQFDQVILEGFAHFLNQSVQPQTFEDPSDLPTALLRQHRL